MPLRYIPLVLSLSLSSISYAETVLEKIKKYGNCYNDTYIIDNVRFYGSLEKLIASQKETINTIVDPQIRENLINATVRTQKCLDDRPQALAEYEASHQQETESNSRVNKSPSSNASARTLPAPIQESTNPTIHKKGTETQLGSSVEWQGQPLDLYGAPCITVKQVETVWETSTPDQCYRKNQYGGCQDRVDRYVATNGCKVKIAFSVKFNKLGRGRGDVIKPGGSYKFGCLYGGRNTNYCILTSFSARVVNY
jgi:hypothetical protein